MSFHTVIAIGNLGRDAELRYTPGGQAVCNFSVAVDDSYKDSDGDKVERTIWMRVSIWGRFAEALHPYLTKGQKVVIDSRLNHQNGSPRIYAKNDGSAGTSFEVTASTVRLLGGRRDGPSVIDEETFGVPARAEIRF